MSSRPLDIFSHILKVILKDNKVEFCLMVLKFMDKYVQKFTQCKTCL